MGHDPGVILDSLAANGIINYDANAFINGLPPRYGMPLDQNPLMASPYGYPYPYGYPPVQPDSFEKHNKHGEKGEHGTSSWKKTLFNVFLGTSAVILALHYKDKLFKLKDKAAGFVGSILEKIPGTAKYSAKKAEEARKLAELTKKAAKWDRFVKVSKYGGIALGAVAGLFALFKLTGKVFGGGSHSAHSLAQAHQAPEELPQGHVQAQQEVAQNLYTPGSKTPEPSPEYVQQQQEQQIAQVQPIQTFQPEEQPQSVVVEQPVQPIEQQQYVQQG